ncbi:MAG TPA: PAS domain-containing protein, partial [Streptomyces sp.]|nr:PAS domain-containing protein [Streptomyces sp.]
MQAGKGNSGQRAGHRELDRLVADTAHAVGAYACLLYLAAPDRSALCLEVAAGLPPQPLSPWQRVGLSVPLPVNDAVRERRLVWVGSGEQMARRYPRAALAVPYHYALAAAPVLDGDTARGALLLLWSGRHPDRLALRQRTRLRAAADAVARQLRRAAAEGHPLRPCGRLRLLSEPAPEVAPEQSLAAAGFAERLPEGCCALDLEGRITFVTRTAAELVGQSADRLLGALPWDVLPWLHDPVFEDRYRSALISRLPTAFPALRPPDTWL